MQVFVSSLLVTLLAARVSANPLPDLGSQVSIVSSATTLDATATATASDSPYQPPGYQKLGDNAGIYFYNQTSGRTSVFIELTELDGFSGQDVDAADFYTTSFESYNVSVFNDGSTAKALSGHLTSNTSTEIALSDSSSVSAKFAKRTDVKTCFVGVAAGICLVLTTNMITSIGNSAGTALKNLADRGQCATEQDVTFSVNGQPLIVLRAASFRASGVGDCDTTAQVGTIIGSIDKFFKAHSTICGTWCLEETHGGSWAGYISIGTYSDAFSALDCKSVGSYGNCLSGGIHDEL